MESGAVDPTAALRR